MIINSKKISVMDISVVLIILIQCISLIVSRKLRLNLEWFNYDCYDIKFYEINQYKV